MTATTNSTNGHLPNQPNGLPLKQELSAPAESGTLLSQTLRANLSGISPRDLVPLLVARRVLRSDEMRTIYSQPTMESQLDKLVSVLEKKNFWMGALVDSLIRNGKSAAAEKMMQIVSTSTTSNGKK